MKRTLTILTILIVCCLTVVAQSDRRVQHKPYIDLRPMHFGILVGAHLQDLEFENVGMQTITDENGNPTERLIVCDADQWSPGFSVGVLAEMRLHNNFSLRITPTMHFGAKHLTFLDLKEQGCCGQAHQADTGLEEYLFLATHRHQVCCTAMEQPPPLPDGRHQSDD